MKERPILFSAPMVRALLAGTKTQTRRIFKPKGFDHLRLAAYRFSHVLFGAAAKDITGKNPTDNAWAGFAHANTAGGSHVYWKCPYGQPGDRLLVRETWRTVKELDRIAPKRLSPAERLWFEADGNHQPGYGKTRVSIHMPRWASRITLEVTGVRVERLNDISDEDARAEGINRIAHGREGYFYHATRTEPHPNNWCFPDDAYKDLWEQINGPGSWAANPWVWVVEFKRIEGGLDNVA